MIRVLLAEDAELIREALVSLLRREPDIDVVATAPDGTSAVREALAHRPDVAVGHLDDLDARPVQRADGVAHLLLGELVRHGVRAVAQGGVDEPHVVGQFRPAHAATSCFARAISSPTRAAAAVMMSRLPAYSGR